MGDHADVKRSGESRYRFRFPETGDAEKKICLLDSPEYSNPSRCIAVTRMEEVEIEIPDTGRRPYFAVSAGSWHRILAERNLPVDGMNNFRDMGGYRTADGHYVRWGKLYRSDHIYNATPKGIAYLKGLGIHTIIDYRSMNERVKYPNKVITPDVKTYCLDPSAHTAELAAQFTSSRDSEDENLVKKIIAQKENGSLVNRYDIVMEQYHNFACKEQSKEAFGQMLRIAADPKASAIVQHCRGGKDRTGFGTMVLLGILGVGKEDLVADYMLTYHNRVARNQVKMDIYRRFTQDPVVLDYLYSLIDTRPEFIEASYDAVMEEYGSFEEYARKELAISGEDLLQLRENYLE